jgi:hypothetical protein
MDNKGKSDNKHKISILAQVDAQIRIHSELAPQSRLSVPTPNHVVKKSDKIERSFIKCGPFSKQQKSLNIHHWRKWNLCLLHGSKKPLKVMLP